MKNCFSRVCFLIFIFLAIPLKTFGYYPYGSSTYNSYLTPVPEINNLINGIRIYRGLGVSWVTTTSEVDDSTAIISGISEGLDLSKINNERILFKSDNYVRKLINNKEVYSFSTSYYGDIYVYEFPGFGTSFYSRFNKYIPLENLPSELKENEISKDVLLVNRNKNILYDKYFFIDYDNFYIENKTFSDEEKNQIKKINKIEYEKITEIQKYLREKRYTSAIAIDKDFLPTYLFMYRDSLKNKYYGNMLYSLLKIKEINDNQKIFNEKVINYQIGLIYFIFYQVDKSYDYLKDYTTIAPKTENQYLSYILSLIHYYKENYSTAIFYGDQIKPDSELYPDALSMIITYYKELNNKQKEKEYIAKLLSVKPTIALYIAYADFFSNKNDKLNIYYKARNLDKSSQAAQEVNKKIIEIEQEKINNSVKNISKFIEVPNWNKYNSSLGYSSQDEFFQKSNDCIKRFKGNDLEKCFASIIKYYDDILQINRNENFNSNYLYRLRQIESELDEANYTIRNLKIGQ